MSVIVEGIEMPKTCDECFLPLRYCPAMMQPKGKCPLKEVKKGKWLHTPTGWYYCSVCDMEPPNETNITTKFCPNCGAEMENEDEYIRV